MTPQWFAGIFVTMMMSTGFKVACAGLLVAGAALYYFGVPPDTPLRRTPPPVVDPITAKKLAIFERARQRGSDPALVALYSDVNQQYFDGELPPIPVQWDDALSEIDALIGDNYHLNGMTNGSMILVSTGVQDDEAEIQRTVCHEAVHVKLHRAPGQTANHGEVFQQELRRIFEAGCFVAILASDAEQQALKEWIDQETKRLNDETEHINAERTRIDGEREDIEQAITEMNARTVAANQQRSGWPAEDEQQALRDRRTGALQASADFNVLLARHNADAGRLNREIERHRLMVAYPRGVDEENVPRRE